MGNSKKIKKNIEQKRKTIIFLLKCFFFCIIIFFYYIFFKIFIFLINYNLYSQNKELFGIITNIERNIENTNKKEIEINDALLGEKIKIKKEIKKYKKVEEKGIKKVENLIKENIFLYGFFCNTLKEDYPNVYKKHYADKCNDKHFMSILIKKIL